MKPVGINGNIGGHTIINIEFSVHNAEPNIIDGIDIIAVKPEDLRIMGASFFILPDQADFWMELFAMFSRQMIKDVYAGQMRGEIHPFAHLVTHPDDDH